MVGGTVIPLRNPLYFRLFHSADAGGVFFVFAVVLGLQTLISKLLGHSEAGFPTVILLLLIIGSIIMFSLGVIGYYIARIYDEVKFRPRYIVSETTDDKTRSSEDIQPPHHS